MFHFRQVNKNYNTKARRSGPLLIRENDNP